MKSWLREAGAHNVLVTSALITMELQNFLPCCIQKKAVVISIGSQMRMMTVIHR